MANNNNSGADIEGTWIIDDVKGISPIACIAIRYKVESERSKKWPPTPQRHTTIRLSHQLFEISVVLSDDK